MHEYMDWVERAALENIRTHLSAAHQMKKAAETTLTILLGGAGGAFALAVGKADAVLPIPLIATSLYLFLVAAILVRKCIHTGHMMTATNEPKKLVHPELSFESVQRAELNGFQQRIEIIKTDNDNLAFWLNVVRYAAIAAPLVFAATWFLSGGVPFDTGLANP